MRGQNAQAYFPLFDFEVIALFSLHLLAMIQYNRSTSSYWLFSFTALT